ncbi:MAG: adenosine deaminase [Traorella sp.]
MNWAKIDLHLHLDGSLYLPWLYETSKKREVIDSKMSFEEYYEMVYRSDFPTKEEGMKRFDIPIAVMQTKEDLFMSIYGLIQILHEQGLLYAEIRFAPQQHCLYGLSQKEVVEAVIEGMNQALLDFDDIRIGIILCMMHKGHDASFNMKENFETIEVAKMFLGKGVVGLDLAGYENTGPFMNYKPLFDKAYEYHIPYTIHAGEMGEGSHVMDAIEMKAWRIGHGINCIQNEKWLQEVIDKQIPLEVCVTSNVGLARNYAAHPIRTLLQKNVKVTINTDNMTFSRTTLNNEHEQLKALGISQEELKQCTYNAIDAAFCDDKTKQWIKDRINQ